MIYLYLFGTCFHFIYVFIIIGKYFKQYVGISPKEYRKGKLRIKDGI